MPAPDSSPPEPSARPESPDGVGDALRAAVERTLTATADSATGTRQRAQSLLDDVVRRGQEAREEVTRRGEEASTRLAEAINDLRSAETEEVAELRGRVARLEARLQALEAQSQSQVEPETSPHQPHEKADPSG